MTKIWFDVLTPKQAYFCHALAQRFTGADYDIVYTTRRYPEVEGALDLLNIDAAVIGRHGGGNRYDKLIASAERVVELARYVQHLQPDVGFAFASPESARVAFGLGIPYYTANDSPHSHFVAQLTIPFAKILFTPWIMQRTWRQLDVPSKKIVLYRGLDPVAWLRGLVPNRMAVTRIGIDPKLDYVVIRPEEVKASYLADIAGKQDPATPPVIERILTTFPDLPVVVLCRYHDQRENMRRRFGHRIILPEGVVDAQSLLAYATLLIGAGGTMNQEACLLGVPVISCYPGEELLVEHFLTKKKLLYRFTDSVQAADKAIDILHHRQRYQTTHHRRASQLLSGMENPAEVITSWVLNRH